MSLVIGICDDEVLHRDILKDYITKILDDDGLDYKLVEYCSGEDLVESYDKCKLDILFLDIQMDKLSGMDAARKIRESDKNVEIIFTTSIVQYVFEAYEVKAYRYLVKPLRYEDLKKQLKLCINDYLDKNSMISIESNKETIVIPIGEILYAEVMRKEVTIYTENKDFTIEISMKRIEKKLINYSFFRCHHSYLVNLKKVNELKNKSVFINNKEIPVSRSKYKNLKINLVNLLGDTLC
ncbi:Probable transcriptional regulatory protein YehT [uncultured Clostridium sp.]|nr:Probable transcriptional regulatory protein YehT [uncultured Clostridium sp.]SCJ46826.1 Probable transcriptional regulatory protein YehT [uncultured Clostridium sp.]